MDDGRIFEEIPEQYKKALENLQKNHYEDWLAIQTKDETLIMKLKILQKVKQIIFGWDKVISKVDRYKVCGQLVKSFNDNVEPTQQIQEWDLVEFGIYKYIAKKIFREIEK